MFSNHREWERTERVGALPIHCYFIPFEKGDPIPAEGREASSRFLSLSGEWQFRAHGRVEDCELEEDLPDVIPVPSCVQLFGYDGMQYTNVRYPFPFDPPYIRKDIPTFHYRRTFTLMRGGARLVFEGVDAAFYVFVNGKFLGYSQISHMTTEFSLDGFAKEGENVLDVIVLKWCASSYLEDQDKWRFTGIFRDVYLLYRDEGCVEDYAIVPRLLPGGRAKVEFTLKRGRECKVTFNGETHSVKEGGTCIFTLQSPRLWSAECPNLYPLTIACGNEVICERVGIRSVRIEGGVFYFNGELIKLLGVNRHEFHPERGACVTVEDMRNDLRLMKSLNVNAVRTSHYPDCPVFYELCDEFGIYVLDEADVEAHGILTVDGDFDLSKYNSLAEQTLYADAVKERVLSMYERDKNRPCVFMWSLGNEAGYGPIFRDAALALRARDSRPIHYESHSNIAGTPEYYDGTLSVASRMYPTTEWMRGFLKDRSEKRPLVLCEYAHAMGNGPGDLKEYWALIRSSERFMGGFIWEWADHAVRTDEGWRYGGDFGEGLHDGNFCVDGIVSADRRLKAGTLEMKHIYQPAEITYADGTLRIFNRNFFKDLESGLTVHAELENGAQEILSRKLSIKPRAAVRIPLGDRERGAAGITVSLPEAQSFASVCLRSARFSAPEPQSCASAEDVDAVTLSREELSVRIEKRSGRVLSVCKNGREYLSSPAEVSVMRAPIDNENLVTETFRRIGVYDASPRITAFAADGGFTAHGEMMQDSKRSILSFDLTVSLCEGGLVLGLDYAIPPYVDRLPCVGLRFAAAADEISYFAYGGRETYPDMKAARRGRFTEPVSAQYHRYVRPQESGNHTGAFFVRAEGCMEVVSAEEFDFSVIGYAARDIMAARHDDELPPQDGTAYVFLGRTEGTGSNACGPTLDETYRVPRKGSMRFSITLL